MPCSNTNSHPSWDKLSGNEREGPQGPQGPKGLSGERGQPGPTGDDLSGCITSSGTKIEIQNTIQLNDKEPLGTIQLPEAGVTLPYLIKELRKMGIVAQENGDSKVISYEGISAERFAYQGGVYSPTQNRIYLVPYTQADEATWHYVDCGTGAIVGYSHGVTAVYSAYAGGVYSPTQNRIYLVPYNQAPEATWHYVDCGTGDIVGYFHSVTAVSDAYIGGVYSPTQNRIYFVPAEQADQDTWHYLDNCID